MTGELIYAIDFGTTNSLLAAASASNVFSALPLDPDAPDPTILRSLLYFPNQKECFYGAKAITEFKHNDLQGRLIRSIKKYLPIRSFTGTWIENRPMNLEDIIGAFLGEMRHRANVRFKTDVQSVVLGRPVRFSLDKADDNYAQYRLERAARVAGFKNIEFVPEPLAAAFELRTKLTESKNVLVADFGGGTSDYTIIRISQAPFRDSDVLAIQGVPVAGDILDGTIMKHKLLSHFGGDVSYVVPFGSNVLKMPVHLIDKLCSPADMSLLRKRDVMEFFRNIRQWSLTDEDTIKMDRLFCLIEDNLGFDIFEEIEKTKRKLSETDETAIHFEHPLIGLNKPIHRGEFEEFASGTVRSILDCLDDTLKQAQLHPSDIDLVFCTGGTARVPILNRELAARFGAEKIQERNNFHSVVEGLAARAKELACS